jgi:hypothetical protein
MNASARNMMRVVQVRDDHNATCPLGPATEVLLAPADIDRLGWEEGDDIAGLRVVSQDGRTPGTIGVRCDADGAGSGLTASVDADVRERALA